MTEETPASIKILGYRNYIKENGKEGTKEVYFAEAPSVKHLLDNLDSIIAEIPEAERYNLHFTIARTSTKRVFHSQEILIFDIDDMDVKRLPEYITPVLSGIGGGVTLDNIAVTCSGNGLHVYILLEAPFTTVGQLKENKQFYIAICKRIDRDLNKHGLIGEADRGILAKSHTMRLPNTTNRKPGKPDTEAYIISNNLQPIPYDLFIESSKMVQVEQEEVSNTATHVAAAAMKYTKKVDTEAVLEGCSFLKHCKENPASVGYEQWFAMVGILYWSRVGNEVIHDYSRGHPDYDYEATEEKIVESELGPGCRLCLSIETMWEGCVDCPNYNKTNTPMNIRGTEFIATEDTGFYNVTKKGPGIPNHGDLITYFDRLHPFIIIDKKKEMYLWEEQHWQPYSDTKIMGDADELFVPHDGSDVPYRVSYDFYKRIMIKRSHVRDTDFFDVDDRMNMQSNILNTKDMTTIPHSPEYGFTYKMEFDYDKDAECPRARRFMEEIMCGDKGKEYILQEFGGICLAGGALSKQSKALFLVGEGANGKSVFLDMLRGMFPEKAVSDLKLNELSQPFVLDQLHGRLLNIDDETSKEGLKTSDLFKKVVTGGMVTANAKYVPLYKFRNRANFILAANDVPENRDASYGLMRRMVIVRFDATFMGNHAEDDLDEQLESERPGIFNYFMEGYKRYCANNNTFSKCEAVDKEFAKFQIASDNVKQFVNDCCVLGDTEEITPKPLYKAYDAYCIDHGIKPIDKKTSRQFAEGLKRIHGIRVNISSGDCKVTKGLRLLEDIETGEVIHF